MNTEQALVNHDTQMTHLISPSRASFLQSTITETEQKPRTKLSSPLPCATNSLSFALHPPQSHQHTLKINNENPLDWHPHKHHFTFNCCLQKKPQAKLNQRFQGGIQNHR